MNLFPAMVGAELRKLLTRASGLSGLAVSALVAVGAVVALQQAGQMTEASVNSQPIAQYVQLDAVTALGWALYARNFFVLPLILLMVTGQLMAGEWAGRTLRALLVRPVSRGSLLGAKFAAVAIYSAMTLLITGLLTLVGAVAIFQIDQPLGPVAQGFAVSWLSDLGLIALGLVLSVLLRSVVGVVVGCALFLMGDMAIRGAIKVMAFFGAEGPAAIVPFLPGNALSAWEGYQSGWDPQAFVGLAVLTIGCMMVAWLRFVQSDVV